MKSVLAKAILIFAFAITTGLVPAATLGQAADDLPPPELRATYALDPAPIPAASEGRIPVSLRLATSVLVENGSHPPPATRLRFEFDRQFRIAFGDVPTCPSGIRSQGRTGKAPCPEARIASGRSSWDVAFPGQEPMQVEGRTSAYKIGPRKMAFHVFLPAPVTADVVSTVELSQAPKRSRYGLRATVSIPKVAGGYGSLLDLGLRFPKGLFSVACPQRSIQSGFVATFAGAGRLSAASATLC